MALAWAVSLVSGEVARQQHQLLAAAADEKPYTQVPPSVFSCTSGLSSTASADAPFTFGKGLLVFVQLSKVGSTSMRYMLYDAYGKAFSFYGCASRCALEPRIHASLHRPPHEPCLTRADMHEGSTFVGLVEGRRCTSDGTCDSTCNSTCDGACDGGGVCHPNPPLPRLDEAELVQGSFGSTTCPPRLQPQPDY